MGCTTGYSDYKRFYSQFYFQVMLVLVFLAFVGMSVGESYVLRVTGGFNGRLVTRRLS